MSTAMMRSTLREKERIARLLRRVTPEKIPQLVDRAAEHIDAPPDIPWRNGVEPMPFDQFCVALDGQPMFDRQVDAWDVTRTLRASHLFSPLRTLIEWVLIWGKGCLAGDTPLYDHKTRRAMPVAEWAAREESLLVWSFDGRQTRVVRRSTPPVRVGSAPILRAVLDGGLSFRATAEHRCMTARGWMRVGEMRPGVTRIDTLAGLVTLRALEPEGEESFYDLTVPDTHCYYDAQGILHHNSGKDYLAAKFVSYVAFLLCHFAVDPATWMAQAAKLDLAPQTPMEVVNTAPNEDLAKNVFFRYLKRFIQHPLFDPFPKSVHADDVKFHDLPLSLYSRHSRSAGLDGFNPLCWLMDEADAFLDSEKRSNAEEIHRILRTSSYSRFRQFSMGLVISYPRIEDGFILRLEARARKNPALFYVDKAATNEVRPNFDLNAPHVREEFENDPAAANAMYLCIPMSTEQAFFEMPEKIAEAVDTTRVPVALVTTDETTTRVLDNGVTAEYVGGTVHSVSRQAGHTYFLAGDGGLKGDTFAVAVFHIDETGDSFEWLCPRCGEHEPFHQLATYQRCGLDEEAREGTHCGSCLTSVDGWNSGYSRSLLHWWRRVGATTDRLIVDGKSFHLPRICEDLLLEFRPQRATRPGEKNRPVDFPAVQEVCRQLITGLGVVRARFDPWNTAQMTQWLQDATGCDVQEISFSQSEQYRRARLVKAMLYSNLLRLLPNERRDREWRRLQRKSTRIDHPEGPNESKDLFDVESVCIWLAATWKCAELELVWT